MDLPARVAAWRERGRDEEVRGHRIHLFEHEERAAADLPTRLPFELV